MVVSVRRDSDNSDDYSPNMDEVSQNREHDVQYRQQRVYDTTTATTTATQRCFSFRTVDKKDSLFSVRICFP